MTDSSATEPADGPDWADETEQKLLDAALPPVMFSVGCETARFAPFVPAAPYLDILGRAHPGEAKGEKFPEAPLPPAPPQSCTAPALALECPRPES